MSMVDLNNKTILVTGAAGFIGSNLVKRIYQETTSATVIGIDNMNDYYDVALKEFRLNELAKYPTFTFVKGNIADKKLITELFEKYKPSVVVNLAAQAGVRYSITNPDAYVESNLVGFFNILEACRHCESLEHLVYASSSSVYGSNKKVPYSTDVTSFVMGVVTCGIIMVVKPLYLGIMSASFAEAWKYVPLLSVATIISCYASYFSVVYTVGAKTKKVFLTTALGAIVNLGTNLILVQPFGMQGIAMGTCLGYIAVLIVRVRDMWVEMGIRFDFKRNILTFIVLFIQSAVVIYFGGVLSVVISCAGILFIALLYRKEMVTIINKLIKKQ